MKKVNIMLSILLSTMPGCAKPYTKEFVQVVQDHRTVGDETIDAVVASIRADMSARNDLSADQQKAVEDLIARLEYLKMSGQTIESYVMTNQVDQKLLADLLRSRWERGQNATTRQSE